MALFFSSLPSPLSLLMAIAFVLASIGAFVLARTWEKALITFAFLFSGVLVFFLLTKPSNERNWQSDVAVLPWADIRVNLIIVHNVRNCDYNTETDFTVKHYDRTYDLNQLQSVDMFLVYWGSPNIAHTMLSFGFKDGSYLCFSIETRKEVGEAYSAIKGFFQQFELTYIVADERDVVRLRTNYRIGEDVYLYRLKVPMEMARKVLLDYLREVNELKAHPQWYRGILTNCTTSILRHTMQFNPNIRYDWRMIVNGHLDEMLYERGTLDTALPFAELKKKSLINPQAKAADKDKDFPRLIRIGLPGM
ncbi:MAG: DUF4105 domain-containing protein [Desulfobulbaceae bacterium]|nr:DUF4105 domain-containing protein [Desulfobulbaceae bacterium]